MDCPVIPELYVANLEASLAFYAQLGFAVSYVRPDERFAMLARENARLMLEEPVGRTFLTGPLDESRGRGINLQIAVSDADSLWNCVPSDAQVVLHPETQVYVRSEESVRVRQFVIADPDGYLLRFSQRLG